MGKITFSFILLCICVGLSVARPRRYPGAGHEWRWGKVRGSDKGRHIGASLDPTFGTLMKQNLKMPEDWVRSQRGMMHQTFGNRFEIGPGKFGLGFGGEFRIPEFEMNLNLGSVAGRKAQNWWEGPNVCYMQSEKVENVTEITSHFRFLSFVCDVSDTTHKCIETIPDLLKTLGLTELTSLLDSVGLSSEVLASDNNNFTVFAPSNEVLAKFVLPALQQHGGVNVMKDIGSVVIVSQEISNSVIEDTRNILLGHVAVGRLTSSRLTDDMIVETASPLKSSIRINTYEQPKKLVTANCKPITSTDNIAINGVVHVVSDVLMPVTGSILDLVKKNPELSFLKTVLGSSPLAATLREPGRYTLLAPTDAAFKKHVELLTRILGDDKKCMENVLQNHLLPNVICSSVIEGCAQTKNSLGRALQVTRDQDNKLYVEGAQIIVTDIMATNGVIHVIDDILVPDEALNIVELASKKNYSEFLKLLERAGLKKDLALAENITVFVPSNEAMQSLPSNVVAKVTSDVELLKETLKYHVVPDAFSCRALYNNKLLDTLEGTSLRINEYSTFPFGREWLQTVQCASFEAETIKGCNGNILVVNKILSPPTGDLVDVLAMDRRFSYLTTLLKVADIADMLQEEGPFTLFAPTNEAFKRLGSDAVETLKKNPSHLKSLLMDHVARDVICCNAIMRSNWFDQQRVRTLSDKTLSVHKNKADQRFIDKAEIKQCDLMATNGVVHVIDDVISDYVKLGRGRSVDRIDRWFWNFK
ncbi:transforming growth factor-beta-induced protein ig-h3-like isoform X2 [Dreissena polymorpha]|uniref:transforming growth factor-beta-induced protein ig-h3-like isoform X2 n=1 Tax=Dreissena polymorpha TaxID=45954 RepID=UPI0022646480|nr:transforming growth factor-beta-induced protein ig-h3-like isoform X2 [Dreissena polymorpha]